MGPLPMSTPPRCPEFAGGESPSPRSRPRHWRFRGHAQQDDDSDQAQAQAEDSAQEGTALTRTHPVSEAAKQEHADKEGPGHD